ncbi:hypothetical protein D3C71_1478470 [compost metagenome]
MQLIFSQNKATFDRIQRVDQKVGTNLHKQRLKFHHSLLFLLQLDVVNQSLQLIQHSIQCLPQLSDFILALDLQPDIKIPHPELAHNALQLHDRTMQSFGNQHGSGRKDNKQEKH